MLIQRALLTRLRLLSICILCVAGLAGGCSSISLTPPSEKLIVPSSLAFQEAQRLFAAGRFQDAINLWEQVPPTDPQYLDAQMAIRQARLQVYQIAEQKVTTEKEVSQVEHYMEQAEQFEQQGEFSKALDMYEEARLLAPDNNLLHEKIEELHTLLEDALERHKALGELYFAQGEYEKAKREWEELLAIAPDHETAKQRLADIEVITATSDSVFFQRGRSLLNKGLINQAKAEFEKAQRINPANTRTLSYLTKVEQIPFTEYIVQKGDTLSSIAAKYSGNSADFTILLDFNHLKAQDPIKIGQRIKIPHILNFRAVLDPQGEDTLAEVNDEVQTNQTDARSLTPSAAAADDNLPPIEQIFEEGITAYNQRNYRHAMTLFQIVYERDPENQEAYEYFMRAATAMKGGKPIVRIEQEENLEQERGMEREIDNLIYQGRNSRKAGDLKSAIAFFEQAAQLAPQNQYLQKDLEKTRDEAKKLITFHLNEGIKFFNREALEDAILEWEKVLDLDPDNPQALEYRRRAEKMLDALATPK